MYTRHKNKYIDCGDRMIGYDKKGRAFAFDKADIDTVQACYWYVTKQGYVQCAHRINGKQVVMHLHREIVKPAEEMEVDHINHDPTDCRRSNLRVCTHRENSINRRVQSNNTAGIKGVNLHPCGKWRARIRCNGKLYEKNGFETAEGAKAAYDAMAKELFGEFACC